MLVEIYGDLLKRANNHLCVAAFFALAASRFRLRSSAYTTFTVLYRCTGLLHKHVDN